MYSNGDYIVWLDSMTHPKQALSDLFCNGHILMQGTLIGSKVYLFGGEDAARRPQGDLYVLDLADKEWQTPQITGTH